MLEVKVPLSPDVKQRYRWQRSIHQLYEMIQASNLTRFCMVQSFDHEALRSIEKLNQNGA